MANFNWRALSLFRLAYVKGFRWMIMLFKILSESKRIYQVVAYTVVMERHPGDCTGSALPNATRPGAPGNQYPINQNSTQARPSSHQRGRIHIILPAVYLVSGKLLCLFQKISVNWIGFLNEILLKSGISYRKSLLEWQECRDNGEWIFLFNVKHTHQIVDIIMIIISQVLW